VCILTRPKIDSFNTDSNPYVSVELVNVVNVLEVPVNDITEYNYNSKTEKK
jgi:hypothetical protein